MSNDELDEIASENFAKSTKWQTNWTVGVFQSIYTNI